MPLVDVVGLAALVILAADDQQIILGVDPRHEPDVMIRIAGVPVQRQRHGATRHRRADHIGHVGRLLRMDDDAIVHRHVGRHDDAAGADRAGRRLHARALAALDALRVGAGVNTPAGPLNRLGKAAEVLQRMELCLARKPQARTGVETERRPPDLDDIVEAGAMRGLELAIQIRFIVLGGAEQVAVEPHEIAGDPLARDDAFDAIDGGRVAFRREPRAALAVEALQIHEAIVERIDEVRGGGAGLAATDAAIVEHDH